MNQDEIIEMARQAGFLTNEIKSYVISPYRFEDQDLYEEIEAFAKLVAKHTLINIDPSKFMSWAEACELGAAKEREALATELEKFDLWGPLAAAKIRARGQA